MSRPLVLVLLGGLSLAPDVRPGPGPAATEVAPAGEPRDEGIDGLGQRLAAACRDFEQALEAAPDAFDLVGALRRLDDELVELRWELDRLIEAGAPATASGTRLLLESTADELAVARARLTEVAGVGPELRALVQLHLAMRAAVGAGRPGRALELYRSRVPDPLDPLDWPSVVRRRIRDVEREAVTAQSEPGLPRTVPSAPPPGPAAGSAPGPAPVLPR